MSNQKGLSLIIIVLILVVIIGAGIFAWQYFGTPKETEVVEVVEVAEKTEAPEVIGPTDCKTNLDCLITASQNCDPAFVTHTITTDIFGVKQTTTSYLEIKELEAEKCIFYIQTKKIDLELPSEVPQEAVNQQKEIYKKLEGRDGTCKFNTIDLTAMLTRWEKGNFESGKVTCRLTPSGNVCKTEGGDFGVAECQGTYFEQPSL